MLEIIFIIFIGRKFYELAKKYKQQLAWVYFIVGLISYYGGAFVFGFLLATYEEISGNYFLNEINSLLLTLLVLPFAAFSCWGVYQLLKKKWHKEYLEKERNKPKISDIGKSEEEIASNSNSF